MKRDVSAELDVDITAPTTVEFQIAVAPQPGAQVTEQLSFMLDGKEIQATEISGEHGNRIHVFDAGVGNLKASYSATIIGRTDPAPRRDIDLSTYLRPSRYAEADKFFGFAATEFGDYTDGVCRDYAHLVVALLRAVNVPARLVAVYAPGCHPMDFHAVAEAFVDGVWRVVDATCLAPRQTMVRIATGRDAADTAFLDNHKGGIVLNNCTVTAVVDGELPADSVEDLVSLG